MNLKKLAIQLHQDPGNIPVVALRAYTDLFPSLRSLVAKYLSYQANPSDVNDALAEGLAAGMQHILLVSTPQTYGKWKKQIFRKMSNAVIEYLKYILAPVSIPRPIRFSLKKYRQALQLLGRCWEGAEDVTPYQLLFEYKCLPSNTCKVCELGLESCPFLALSQKEVRELEALLIGETGGSLDKYASNYRKTYNEWIEILRLIPSHTHSLTEADLAVELDLDYILTLKQFEEKVNKIDGRLFEMYCNAITVLDLSELSETLPTPRGKLSREIKEHFGLTTHTMRNLLQKAHQVFCEFHKEGQEIVSIC